ncbi:GRAS family transcription factor [Perilla frutescens var. hirtella]|uniref:GRAS family transcription factor n=1 Tax=Perilla frutescens var. hirtella TaxID=608512 RepID=A0AAD4JJJ7_PERFH|nr:GRAS family transcription factor [Perilla frutescens var. hirtella]KAH6834947.1 GRAS family transcription factor [Perilla frutescens var. hirtella]
MHPQNCTSNTSSDSSVDASSDGKWASKLLRDCAAAMSDKDSTKIHHLLWMLNELASPYGDCDQKLASYFLQALFCKATDSGRRCYKTLISVAEKSHSFDSLRKLILKFQELSPWTTFGHVASNGAMLEALDGDPTLHIIDISNTLCTQWPTLLEALATRSDETPRLKLTAVVTTAIANSVMKDIAPRMEKFARLMGVPFEFTVMTGLNRLGELTKEALGVRDDEAVAVNCVNTLRRLDEKERKSVIQMIHSLKPKVVTIVEEEADFSSSDFVKCFEECLRFYTIYFDMLEECFTATSNEKLMLERECSRSIVRVLACDDDEIDHDDSERREKGRRWSERLRETGFTAVGYSDDVVDDVKALLKRYRAGWSLVMPGEDNIDDHHQNQTAAGIYLAWKEEPVVWASVWKPSN